MKRWIGYEKGVNLGGWFSQCDYSEERFDHFIEEKDIETLSTWGLDHLRLPIDYNLVEDADGGYIERGFERIKTAIEWCRKYGLNLILDLHKTAGYSFDEGEAESGFFSDEVYQERFYRLWEEFARRFSGYGEHIAFELLNEVTDKEYCEAWNRISKTCIERIRKIAPETVILVGGYWNNSVAAIPDLALPYDEHIVYNFHCYDPLIFTHQGASWVKDMPADFRMHFKNPISTYRELTEKNIPDLAILLPTDLFKELEEKEIGPWFFEYFFTRALQTAKERDVALYCGEYGVINLASAEDTLEWYEAIHEVFEKYHIGRAAWSYREMDFGLSDAHIDPIREKLLTLL